MHSICKRYYYFIMQTFVHHTTYATTLRARTRILLFQEGRLNGKRERCGLLSRTVSTGFLPTACCLISSKVYSFRQVLIPTVAHRLPVWGRNRAQSRAQTRGQLPAGTQVRTVRCTGDCGAICPLKLKIGMIVTTNYRGILWTNNLTLPCTHARRAAAAPCPLFD